MSCCNPNTTPFANELITTVPYTGSRPIVTVLYLQPDNTLQEAGIFTLIEITPTDVIIDHGGLSSGVVKLLQ
jgi:hypothetical protein